MKNLLRLAVIVFSLTSVASFTGGSITGGNFNDFVTQLCPWGDECDEFGTDSITSGAWTAFGQGWSVSGGTVINAAETPFGETFLMRTAGEGPRTLDNCQVLLINEPEPLEPAPGFILYSENADPETSNRLELVFAYDEEPINIVLRSSTGGAVTVVEDVFVNFVAAGMSPYFVGACIDVTGNNAVVNVYDFGNSPVPADPANWASSHIVELFHDASPSIGGSLGGYGLRNWNDDGFNIFSASAWAISDNEIVAPPNMFLTQNPIFASVTIGSIPADTTFDIQNIGGGTFDWDASVRNSIEDCGGTGGADWVTIPATNTGTGLASGSPVTLTVDYAAADIPNCAVGSYDATFQVDGSNGSPTAVQNGTNVLTVTLVVTSEPVGGSYPDNNPSVWGHLHPSCPAAGTFGTCSSTAAAGTTIQNCNGGRITLQGDNITLSCVNLSGSFPSVLECSDATGCQGITITKATVTGGGPSVGMTAFRLSSAYGSGGNHTMLIEKSVIQKSRVGLMVGNRWNKDAATIEPNYSLVVRENIFRELLWPPTSHSEHIVLSEGGNGILFENNVFDCDSSHNSNNPCNTAHFLGQPLEFATVKNIDIIGNRFIGDRAIINGYEFTFDSHFGSSACITDMHFNNNLIEVNGIMSGIMNVSGGCTSIGNRPGSTCDGNTLINNFENWASAVSYPSPCGAEPPPP